MLIAIAVLMCGYVNDLILNSDLGVFDRVTGSNWLMICCMFVN